MQISPAAARRLPALGVACACLALLVDCGPEEPKWITQSDLRTIKPGQAVRLSEITGKSSGTVCVLYPYQDSLHEKPAEAARINQHLAATKYAADEGHWALVLADDDTVEVARFTRVPDIDHGHLRGERLPQGFERAATNCVAMARAGLAKLTLENRTYLVLGELK